MLAARIIEAQGTQIQALRREVAALRQHGEVTAAALTALQAGAVTDLKKSATTVGKRVQALEKKCEALKKLDGRVKSVEADVRKVERALC